VLQLREVPGLAERMGSLMCVDADVSWDDDGEDEGKCELGVEETLEREVGEAKENGDGTLRWLELEGLNIDDAMLVSLALPARFPVSNSLFFVYLFHTGSVTIVQKRIMKVNALFKGKFV